MFVGAGAVISRRRRHCCLFHISHSLYPTSFKASFQRLETVPIGAREHHHHPSLSLAWVRTRARLFHPPKAATSSSTSSPHPQPKQYHYHGA